MSDIIIKPNQTIQEIEEKNQFIQSALADFNLPILVNNNQEEERIDFIKLIRECIVDADAIQKLANSKVLCVEIPPHLRKLYEDGKLHFDDSQVMQGSYTPNLRNEDGELVGQATLRNRTDLGAVNNALSNLTLYNSIQSIAEQIEVLNQKSDWLIKGQQNDRCALITGAYETYALLLNENQRSQAVPILLYKVKTGLHQMHLHVNERVEDLINMKSGNAYLFWHNFWHKGSELKRRLRDIYGFQNDFQNYYLFIYISDMLMNMMGQSPTQIKANHNDFINFCDRIIQNIKFQNNMQFYLEHKYTQIDELKSLEDKFKTLIDRPVEYVKIGLTDKDINLLNQQYYG